jgi:DNA transformation protein
MNKLTDLPNIGKALEEQLNMVGVYTYDDLVDAGSCETWIKIKAIDPSACINRLMALEGAIQKIRWHDLSVKDKKDLKGFYENNKE